MRTSIIAKTLGVLALLGSSAGMAASVTITPSTNLVAPGDTFTLTITADVPNTFAVTFGLAFDPTKVIYVSGIPLSPWNVLTKNSAPGDTPTVFNPEAPTGAIGANPGVYNVAQLTFSVLAGATPGSVGIIIDDDGGNESGFFDATTADYIPVTYTQANVQVVPAPGALLLLATALGGLVVRRKLAA